MSSATHSFVFALSALVAVAAPALGSVSSQGEQVTFKYRPGQAKSVHLAGSFTEWKLSHELKDPDGDGLWEVTIKLPEGRHLYKFVVDGSRWTHDTDHEESEPDGQGGKNSVVVVGAAAKPSGRVQTGSDRPTTGGFGTTKVRKKQLVFTGEVFFIPPNSQRLPDLGRMKPSGRIYAETFNIEPRNFSDGFPGISDRYEWFAIRYRGTFVAETTGKYKLRLLSDDGARLYVNGKLCLDNDGLHGPKSVGRVIRLKKGEHKIVLDYMQGPALEVALQLMVTKPTSTQEEPLRASSAPLPEKEEEGSRERH